MEIFYNNLKEIALSYYKFNIICGFYCKYDSKLLNWKVLANNHKLSITYFKKKLLQYFVTLKNCPLVKNDLWLGVIYWYVLCLPNYDIIFEIKRNVFMKNFCLNEILWWL